MHKDEQGSDEGMNLAKECLSSSKFKTPSLCMKLRPNGTIYISILLFIIIIIRDVLTRMSEGNKIISFRLNSEGS